MTTKTLDPQQYWDFLTRMKEVLEWMVEEYERDLATGESPDYRHLARLRLLERDFNVYIDYFMHVTETSGVSVGIFLREKFGEEQGQAMWRNLKDIRDNLADRVSSIIEANPKATEEYNSYCENLKNIRSLGAMI